MQTLQEAFQTFKHDAVRIEALPYYYIPEEQAALEAMSRGERLDLSFLAGWHEHVKSVTESGRTQRRLRLVSEPLTEYERNEIKWGYPSNAECGEEIRVLNRSAAPSLKDVWIFDGNTAFEILYDENGGHLGSQPVAESEARSLVAWLEGVWPTATNFENFSIE